MKQENLIDYKRLHEDLNAILNASDDSIFVTDGQGFVLYLNKACERIDNVQAMEIIGKNMRDLVKSGVYSESVALRTLEKGSVVSILQKTKDGKEIMATGTPIIKDGIITKVVVNARDITELNKLRKNLDKVEQRARQVESEVELLRTQQMASNNIVFRSPEMQRVVNIIIRVAAVDSTVLIEGESGVGKDVISKMIHSSSKRKDNAFIKIDCSSIPETLMESELFGYEKGAFTGANKEGKIGLIELANGGTLFLDEIGELPLMLQAKMLRTIQDREIVKIGGKNPIPVDIRVIAATNKDLQAMVKEKRFRDDLYYRLNVVPVFIPPLRERREDIYPLIVYFLDKFNVEYGLNKLINQEVYNYLLEYSWPGNVRELANVIERLVVTTENTVIEPSDLPADIMRPKQAPDILNPLYSSLAEAIDEYEKRILLQVMQRTNSTQEMGKALQLDASTIRRKLNKHKIKIKF